MCEGIAVRPLIVGGSGVHSYSKTHPADMPAALEAGTPKWSWNCRTLCGLVLHPGNGHGSDPGKRAFSYEAVLRRGESDSRGDHYGDFSGLRAPIVSLNIRDYDSGEVADELAYRYEICTRAGAHCAPLMHRALGTESTEPSVFHVPL